MGTYVYCKNRGEFDKLVLALDELGYKWRSGGSLLSFSPYNGDAVTDSTGIEIIIKEYDRDIAYTITRTEMSKRQISFRKYMRSINKLTDFTKEDLEDGMIIKVKDGTYYMYFEKFRKFVRNGGYLSLNQYLNDLTYNCINGSFNVVSIYEANDLTSLDFNGQDTKGHLNQIWERPIEIIMTVSEIEKKLGIKNLKIISDKD